ncbi:MAG: LCP family protein [Thermacetogeniaceae bacterium]
MRKKARKNTKAVFSLVLLALTILTGLSIAGKYYLDRWLFPPKEDVASSTPSRFNILLLGSDARPGEKIGNTDTIIVAQIDQEKLSLLSIPRDTLVEIPGYGKNKINSACRYGGPELTARVVSELIGIPVKKYALIRWSGFIKIVDTLGGVDLYVPRDMHYDPQDGPDYKIDLHKGYQHLNGKEALAFVRFRMEALGDIDRTKQQLQFMKALAEKIKQPKTLVKLPVLIPEIYKNVETNVTLGEALALAKAGYNLGRLAVVTQTLPGYFLTLNGASYWGVDPEQARQVAFDLFEYGLTTDRVVLEPPPHILNREKQAVQVAQKPSNTEPLTGQIKEVQIEIGNSKEEESSEESAVQQQAGCGPNTCNNSSADTQNISGNPQMPESATANSNTQQPEARSNP